jgi:hypothetical protein
VFDGSHNTPNATATGIEQPQWSRQTGMFYVSVPQIIPSDATAGGVSVIDPISKSVTATYPVPNCSPAGLALGPDYEALIGCGGTFGTTPNVVTQSQIINIKTGKIVKTVPQVGGSDEVWYDSGTGHYYLAARNNADNTGKIMPSLGTIDAVSHMFDGNVPTSTSAHSVGADRFTHSVYVPIGCATTPAADPTNPCPDVSKGCIAVYLPSAPESKREGGNDHEHGDDWSPPSLTPTPTLPWIPGRFMRITRATPCRYWNGGAPPYWSDHNQRSRVKRPDQS